MVSNRPLTSYVKVDKLLEKERFDNLDVGLFGFSFLLKSQLTCSYHNEK